MSEQTSNRDEKGLTLSGRTILRILMELVKVLMASRKLGEKPGYELLQSPTVLVEIRSLLWIASQMAKRLGSKNEVEAYLKKHEEEDGKVILEGMTEASKSLLEDILAHGGLKKCPTCNEFVCPVCDVCHTCNKSEKHETNPFGFADGGKPN